MQLALKQNVDTSVLSTQITTHPNYYKLQPWPLPEAKCAPPSTGRTASEHPGLLQHDLHIPKFQPEKN